MPRRPGSFGRFVRRSSYANINSELFVWPSLDGWYVCSHQQLHATDHDANAYSGACAGAGPCSHADSDTNSHPYAYANSHAVYRALPGSSAVYNTARNLPNGPVRVYHSNTNSVVQHDKRDVQLGLMGYDGQHLHAQSSTLPRARSTNLSVTGLPVGPVGVYHSNADGVVQHDKRDI